MVIRGVLAFKTSPFTFPSLTSCLVTHMMSLSRVDYSSGVFCSGNHDCILPVPSRALGAPRWRGVLVLGNFQCREFADQPSLDCSG